MTCIQRDTLCQKFTGADFASVRATMTVSVDAHSCLLGKLRLAQMEAGSRTREVRLIGFSGPR